MNKQPRNLDEVGERIRAKEAFNFTNIFGEFRGERITTSQSIPPRYVVYSYGVHYPLYVYDYEACQWYGNADKSTATTERHKAKFKPYSVAQWVDSETLQHIAVSGIVNTTAERMAHELL